MAANHYETMGLDASATAEQIKEAWKRLAQKLHPDKIGGDGSAFAALQEAYAILSDPQKRQDYDARDQATAMVLIDALLSDIIADESAMITDAIGIMRVHLVELIDDAKKTRKAFQAVRGRMVRVIRRTKTPSALLTQAMAKKLADIDVQLRKVDDNLATMRKAMDIVEGATFDVSIAGEHDLGSPLFNLSTS